MSRSAHEGLTLGEDGTPHHARAEPELFGFWVFLMSDALLFALLFATYGAMLVGTAGGPGPRDLFKLKPSLIETALLLTSSFTWGMASVALKYGDAKPRLLAWMGTTLVLGVAFLSMEVNDFTTMFAKGAFPSRSGFLSAFFGLVPLHGLHVLAGCIWISVMAVQVILIGTDERTKTNLLRLGLFWHFLDIIWIAIFSVVFLQGLAP
ncbi:cytochrome c oxidase subunit 3 [Sphingomonas sp. RB3P16]|uniref:cytochrome c oxidase subunit 3 n=1 Tax=Parasphingomonas frigoris TaxID=3096163 RepID=UPI002FCA61EF